MRSSHADVGFVNRRSDSTYLGDPASQHVPRPALKPCVRDRLPGVVEIKAGGCQACGDDKGSRHQKLLHHAVALPIPEKHEKDEEHIAALIKQVDAEKAG